MNIEWHYSAFENIIYCVSQKECDQKVFFENGKWNHCVTYKNLVKEKKNLREKINFCLKICVCECCCFALLLVGRCVCYLFFSFFIRFVVVVAVAIFFVVTDQLYWQSNKKRVKNENDKKGRYQSQYNKNWIKWRKSHVKNGCIKSSRDHIFTKTCVHHMCAPFFFTQ